ncbi:MAG TPA: ATP-binding protein [bacterium]|nr:ATP-binding protein [bacterium]HPN45618.1 ATP-binding protein [bacterium]
MPVADIKPEILLEYETEIKHLVNDLRLTTEEYEISRRNYFEIYSKLLQTNEQLQAEIKERKQAREELAIRLRYETGIANFSQALLITKDKAIDNALPFLLQASQASRVYIFENFTDPDNVLYARKTHEVCAKGINCLRSMGYDFKNICYSQGLNNYAEILSQRKPVIGIIDDFTEPGRQILNSQSIVSIVVIPIFINEKWYGVIGFDDIHEKRHWNEADIRMLETSSEIIAAYLERSLAEEKLYYAKKLAEDASRLKSQLVFNVSHEIRTPLNCIIGFAESIQLSGSLPEIHQNAGLVLQQADLLLMLIGDLLDHAKIEAGKMLIENRPFDLYALLERLSGSLGSLARDKGIAFIIDIPQDTPRYLQGDELRLLQVLMNLSGNAVKFTEQGSIHIRVESTENRQNYADMTLLFSIIDTGIGIPKEKHQEIFNSFTQADGSITRKYGGTGLGTTIARQLVELMGGTCGLESEPGKGSRFWFTTPFKFAPEKSVEQQAGDANQAALHDKKLKTGKILVAEDYLPNLQVVLQHLTTTGYSVDSVQNGAMAVAACNDKEYDLILLDVQMPEMDGYQAARAIRSGNSLCKNKPIIAITAHADSTSRQNCVQAGMNDILIKPVRRDSFLPFIDNWITGKNQNKEINKAPDRRNSILWKTMAPFDYKRAIYEFGGNKPALDNVLKEFLDNLDEQIKILYTARNNQDSEKLRTTAHRIRGGAANLTAVRLAYCAESLENCAIQGQLDQAGSYLTEFESEVDNLKKYILKQKIVL